MSLRVLPLGGLGEFGANSLLWQLPEGESLVIDTGVALGTLEEYGVGFEVPDFRQLELKNPLAVLLTHGHDDHAKGLPFFLDAFPGVPVAASATTWPWVERATLGLAVQRLQPAAQLSLSSLSVEYLPCSHSIPGACLLRLQTEVGTAVVATDFRLSASALGELTNLAALAQWGEEGVDLLFLDATNALVATEPPTESTVASTLASLVQGAQGAVVAVSFASHVGRFAQLLQAAAQAGRFVVAVGRGLEDMLADARRLELLAPPPGLLRGARELPRLPREQLVLVVTGSQGERGSAFPRLALGELAGFRLRPGDLVLHAARTIPGNEKRLAYFFDHCVRQGARVVTATEAPLHASGHAHRGELVQLLELLRPRWVVPIHGQRRHLQEVAHLAAGVGAQAVVVENGEELHWSSRALTPSGQRKVVGRILVDVEQDVLEEAVVWERRAAARGGVVVAVLALPGNPQLPLPNPHLECFGLRLPGVNRARLGAELGTILRQTGLREAELLRITMINWLQGELRRRLGRKTRVVALVVEM